MLSLIENRDFFFWGGGGVRGGGQKGVSCGPGVEGGAL